MSDDITVLRTYTDELQAQLAASVLEANGIAAQVHRDNAGGWFPSMPLVYPVRLLVRSEDAELALEILDTPADRETGEEPDGGDA